MANQQRTNPEVIVNFSFRYPPNFIVQELVGHQFFVTVMEVGCLHLITITIIPLLLNNSVFVAIFLCRFGNTSKECDWNHGEEDVCQGRTLLGNIDHLLRWARLSTARGSRIPITPIQLPYCVILSCHFLPWLVNFADRLILLRPHTLLGGTEDLVDELNSRWTIDEGYEVRMDEEGRGRFALWCQPDYRALHSNSLFPVVECISTSLLARSCPTL